jgi:hypothetical protein
MPIDHLIDHKRRLVLAWGSGMFSDEDVFAYQREVWSRPDVIGYGELMDMTDVKSIPEASSERLMELATLATEMDTSSGRSRFAIIAPDDLAYGLASMFATFRSANVRSKKEVAVFRTRAEASAFLGLPDTPSHP